MCFTESSSWAALFAGTTLVVVAWANIVDPVGRAYLLAVQYSLLMQAVDALAWRAVRLGASDTHRKRLSSAARLLNITQPAVLFAALATTSAKNDPAWVLTSLAALAGYTWALLISSPPQGADMFPKTCPHMVYNWWRDPYTPPLYLLVLLLVMTHARPSPALITYFTASFALSVVLYRCGRASIWCFAQVLAPLAAWHTYGGG